MRIVTVLIAFMMSQAHAKAKDSVRREMKEPTPLPFNCPVNARPIDDEADTEIDGHKLHVYIMWCMPNETLDHATNGMAGLNGWGNRSGHQMKAAQEYTEPDMDLAEGNFMYWDATPRHKMFGKGILSGKFHKGQVVDGSVVKSDMLGK
jgi:hypothetical protein